MKNIILTLTISLLSGIASAQIGDSCSIAIPMPINNNSILTGNILTNEQRWFVFIPQTSEVKITLTNTNLSSGHIHDLMLMEGVCNPKYFIIGHDRKNDTTLTILAHDLIVGIPYFIATTRDRVHCKSQKCRYFMPVAQFDLQVESLSPPVVTELNGITYLDGKASHIKNEVIIRISKTYLKMNNVDNPNKDDMPVPVFVKPAMIQRMANAILSGNTIGLGQLRLKKVFPNMTSANTTSVSRIGETITIPDFWETFILTIPDSMSVFISSRALGNINGSRFSEPNYVSEFTSIPNDNFYATNQASLHPTATYPNAHINVEGAWDIETGKSFVKIGIYDTGIDQTHDDLNNGKVVGGYNFKNSTPLSSPYDNDGHGTSCAGIIGAYRNNTTGVAGIAGGDGLINNDGCSLFDMRIGNGGFASNSTIANAITTGATSSNAGGYGLHIMSNSWGSPSSSRNIHDAVQYAVQNGVIFLASRGNFPNNQGNPLDGYNYPATFQDEMVINVGASGTNGAWKTNGNGNPMDVNDNTYESMIKHNVDIIAPGTNAVVYTTEANTNNYHGFNGTSSACPHVAGIAGLMLSHVNQPSPVLSNLVVEDVENILQRNAIDQNSTGYDDYAGWGLVDATKTIKNIEQPAYKVQHFGIGQNASSSITATNIGTNVQFILPQSFQSLPASTYFGDKYLVTITLNYSLDNPNDQIIGFWPRFSSTLGWSAANPANTDNWCQIISVTNTQAVLRTYIYNFLYNQNGSLITDPWFPTELPNAKVALSIYTVDPTVVGIDDIDSDNFSLSAFPNPANNNVTFSFTSSNSQNISLVLFDSQGKIVKKIAKEKVPAGTQQYNISLTGISEGLYYYRLITEDASYSKKLVLIK